jgi:hypothetical protein
MACTLATGYELQFIDNALDAGGLCLAPSMSCIHNTYFLAIYLFVSTVLFIIATASLLMNNFKNYLTDHKFVLNIISKPVLYPKQSDYYCVLFSNVE